MSENRIEVLTGAVVLAVAVGFLVWAGKSQGYVSTTGSYPLHASFRSAQGVSAGTDVRMSGVKIGSVRSVSLDQKTFFADTTVSINSGIEIPDDSQMIVASDGLMGNAYIEVLPGGAVDNFEPGDQVTDTQGAVSMLGLMMKFVGGAAADSAKAGDQPADGADSGVQP